MLTFLTPSPELYPLHHPASNFVAASPREYSRESFSIECKLRLNDFLSPNCYDSLRKGALEESLGATCL